MYRYHCIILHACIFLFANFHSGTKCFALSVSLQLSIQFPQDTMLSLLSICRKYLQSHLDLHSLDHWLDVRTSAKHIQQRDLLSSLDDHIGRSFMKIVRSSAFKNLTEDKLATLISLNSLVVADEDCVFESVQSWISEDPDIRSRSFPRLLPLVRICFLSPDYLNGTVKPFVREMRSSLGVTEEEEEGAVVVDSKHIFNKAALRDYEKVILFVDGCSSERSELVLKCYGLRRDSWSNIIKIPKRREECLFSLCTVKEKVYLLCKDGSNRLCNMREYDLRSNTSRDVSPPQFAGGELAAVDNKIYKVDAEVTLVETRSQGQEVERVRTVFGSEVLDLSEPRPRWRPIASPPQKVRSLVVLCGKLYCLGFYGGYVGVHQPGEDTWRNIGGSRNIDEAATSLGGKMYILRRTGVIDCYTPATGRWAEVTRLKVPRENCGLVGHRGQLLVLGGWVHRWGRGRVYQSEAVTYSPASHLWTKLGDVGDFPLLSTTVCLAHKMFVEK